MDPSPPEKIFRISNPLLWILFVGLLLRIYAYSFTFIINLDGAVYIHQAREIYSRNFSALTDCGLWYVPNYSFFITGAYCLFRDWVFSAKIVNLFFGIAALIPLYFLFRRFFNKNIANLTTLIFAVMPLFVGRSVDVVRGPIAWFFWISGLFLFIRYLDWKKNRDLVLCSIAFLLGAWARIEGISFIVITTFFIVFSEKEKKIAKVLIFNIPVAVIFLIALTAAIRLELHFHDLYRGEEIIGYLIEPFSKYKAMQTSLESISEQLQLRGIPVYHPYFFMQYFIPHAANFLWLIALGVFLNALMAALFYPFFLIFLVGLVGFWRKLINDIRAVYLTSVGVIGFFIIYLHILKTWQLENRFLAIIIYPGAILIGFGVERIVHKLKTHVGWREAKSCIIIGVLIILSTLGINLDLREQDKTLYKEIGKYIAEAHGLEEEILVSTPISIQQWISFYANLEVPGAPCPQKFDLSWDSFPNSYGKFLNTMKEKNINYFLFVENRWPKDRFDIKAAQYHNDMQLVKTWDDPERGLFLLFKII